MSDSVTKYFERENEDLYDEFMAFKRWDSSER